MFHPLLYEYARVETRVQLRRRGLSRPQVNEAMDAVTESAVDSGVAATGAAVPPELVDAAPPAGVAAIDWAGFWQKCKDFINGPGGKALIAFLVSLAMAALGL